ncbi:[weak similarity to] Fe(II) trafficking protein YggX [methanotrophic bacterial endosymbiont of Bathymodiolus sp.]|nr:[weak similarity to] Fe(II) trafficking protein YggX [methanotrophic bacterial endosymbiont of Bathymodiolus sp.]
MTRYVNCVKLGTSEEGLTSLPFPGAKGQYIYDNVSQKAGKNGSACKPC